MTKRIFGMLLCICMLVTSMGTVCFAEDSVKAGEKAITTRQTSIYEDMATSKSSGVVAKNTVVDVLEAFVVSPTNSLKYHKYAIRMSPELQRQYTSVRSF